MNIELKQPLEPGRVPGALVAGVSCATDVTGSRLLGHAGSAADRRATATRPDHARRWLTAPGRRVSAVATD